MFWKPCKLPPVALILYVCVYILLCKYLHKYLNIFIDFVFTLCWMHNAMTCSHLQVFKNVWIFDTVQDRNGFLFHVGDSD